MIVLNTQLQCSLFVGWSVWNYTGQKPWLLRLWVDIWYFVCLQWPPVVMSVTAHINTNVKVTILLCVISFKLKWPIFNLEILLIQSQRYFKYITSLIRSRISFFSILLKTFECIWLLWDNLHISIYQYYHVCIYFTCTWGACKTSKYSDSKMLWGVQFKYFTNCKILYNPCRLTE